MINEPKQYTDEVLEKMICSLSTKDRDAAFHFIFSESGWRQSAFSIVRRQYDGEIAKEAVQQALILLDKNIREGKYDTSKSMKNYFIGICEGRAYSIVRSKRRIDGDDKIPIIPTNQTPETLALNEEITVIIRRLLNQLKEPCPEVLKLYMLSYSRRETNEILDIGTEGAVGKKIFDCRKELAKLIDKSPTLKRFFNRQ